jgi:P-type Mg2+ transporter
MESVISACVIVLVVRTRRPFFKSRPGKYLILLTLLVSAAALAFPYLPVGRFFNFEFLPLWYIPVVFGIVVLYIGGAELTKYIFYKKVKF